MTMRFLICGVLSLCFALLVAPVVLVVCKKLKAGQSILHYVDKHSNKAGTPTMGGVVFLLTLVFAGCLMTKTDFLLGWFVVLITFAYGILGFLDDFIKVKNHHNAGLKPYQKIVGQAGVALAVSLFLYFSGRTSLSFFGLEFDIGFGIIPLAILVLVATTNSVNLTDGLDGLAGGTSCVYILVFGVILFSKPQKWTIWPCFVSGCVVDFWAFWRSTAIPPKSLWGILVRLHLADLSRQLHFFLGSNFFCRLWV